MRIAKESEFNQNAYIVQFMKTHYKRISILFNKQSDAEIIAWLQEQPNISAYIKRLIIEDMKK